MNKQEALAPQEKDVYALMDRLDDDLIKAEIENRIVKTWIYSFQSQGKTLEGLSKVGVDACCSEMAKNGHVIREGEVRFQVDPTDREYVLFMVSATRVLVDPERGEEQAFETVWGEKRQWTKFRKKDGTIVDDNFWFEKGAQKAARNARARLIPEEVRSKIITLARGSKDRVRDLGNVSSSSEAHTQTLPASDRYSAPRSSTSGSSKGKKVTAAQIKRLWAIAYSAVEGDKEEAGHNVRQLLTIADDGRGVKETKDLTTGDYEIICKALESGTLPNTWIARLQPQGAAPIDEDDDIPF